MLDIILAGGWLMAPIILCSILTLTIVGAVVGIPMILFGILMVLRGLF